MRRRAIGCVASLPSPMAIAIAAMCMVPCASSAAEPADAVGADDERHQARGNELMAEGDEHQAAGAHTAAARAYAKAFDAFAERSTSDAKEKQAVSLAVDEFRLAQQAEPESLALLEEEAALLERLEARPEHEGAMAEELARVRARIEELRRQQQPPEQAKAPPKPAGSLARTHLDLVLLGSGVVGIVGGVALLGVGGWTFGVVRDRREERLAALDADEYPNEDGLRAGLDQWHQRGRGIATGLVVGGAVLTGVGIGLTSWGAVRLWRARRPSKRHASFTVPMIAPDRIGLVTTVRF